MVLPAERDLGRQLSVQVRKRRLVNPIVMAVAPGGVRLARDLASHLRLPLDIMSTVAVVVPGYQQVHIGVVAGGLFWPDEDSTAAGTLPIDYVQRLAAIGIRRQEALDRAFRRGLSPLRVEGSTVVLVGNGWSSGGEIQAAVASLELQGAIRMLYVSPLCSEEIHESIQGKVETIAVYPPTVRQSVLLGVSSLKSATTDEAAGWVATSRLSPRRRRIVRQSERPPLTPRPTLAGPRFRTGERN
jgi:putative phosphoribosyl transferase